MRGVFVRGGVVEWEEKREERFSFNFEIFKG